MALLENLAHSSWQKTERQLQYISETGMVGGGGKPAKIIRVLHDLDDEENEESQPAVVQPIQFISITPKKKGLGPRLLLPQKEKANSGKCHLGYLSRRFLTTFLSRNSH